MALLWPISARVKQEVIMAAKWIAGAIQHPGALHKALKVPAGKKIPAGKLKVKSTDSALMKKRKNLAKTLGKMKHK